MKKKVVHYAIFDIDEEIKAAGMECNIDMMVFADQRRPVEPDRPLLTGDPKQEVLVLIPDQLEVTFFEEGSGQYPAPGQYVSVRQRIKFEGENYEIRRESGSFLYGQNKNEPGFELFFSIARHEMKARIKMGPKMLRLYDKDKN